MRKKRDDRHRNNSVSNKTQEMKFKKQFKLKTSKISLTEYSFKINSDKENSTLVFRSISMNDKSKYWQGKPHNMDLERRYM
jgi:hypothetical protein